MSQNLRAFLQVLRACEGTAPAEGYRALFGWRPGRSEFLFGSFADHPRVRTYETHDEFIRNGKLDYTTAAGAYQITASTWDDFTSAVGPRDFSPASQDECAAWLIERAGAMSDVKVGDLETALAKCGGTWASLPGSPYGQPTKSLAYCQTVFARAVDEAIAAPGTQPAAPIEDRSTPARSQDIPTPPQEAPTMGFLIPLLGSLASVFAPLLQQKVAGALGVKDPVMANTMAEQLMGIVKGIAAGSLPPQVTPESPTPVAVDPTRLDPVVAVGIVKSNPALLAAAEVQIGERLAAVLPAIQRLDEMERSAFRDSEDSRNAAAERARIDPNDQGTVLIYGALVLIGALILFVCAVAGWQVVKTNSPTTEVWAAITGLIAFATGVVTTIYGYRFGSSRQSGAKDVLIAEMSRK